MPFLGSTRTLTDHEVYVSLPAREMLESGDWIVPNYAHRTWLAKPPLVYWMTAGVAAARGVFDEWTARLPSAASTIVLCVAVAWLAGRWFGRAAGLLAGFVQATCVYTFMQGRLGEIDMPLACLLALAFVSVAPHMTADRVKLPLRAAIAFHLFVGLGVLAKGPMALLLVGAFIIAWCTVRRSVTPLRAVVWTPGVLVFPAVVLPWPAMAVARVGEAAWREWYEEYVMRLVGTHRLGREPPWYYLLHAPWLALPWTIVLLLGAPKLWPAGRADAGRRHAFLWTWFGSGLLVLSLSAGKHQHYVIPALPPLSVLTAVLLDAHLKSLGLTGRRVYAAVFAGAFVAYLIVGGWVMPARDPRAAVAAFVKRTTSSLPASANLYVANLGESAAYFYVARDYRYADSLQGVPTGDVRVFVLTTQAHAAGFADVLGFAEVDRVPPEAAAKEKWRLVLLKSKADADGG
jgi:4-amino-4-deoxy-L-arabinose transferase-like glycosyltransferase